MYCLQHCPLPNVLPIVQGACGKQGPSGLWKMPHIPQVQVKLPLTLLWRGCWEASATPRRGWVKQHEVFTGQPAHE